MRVLPLTLQMLRPADNADGRLLARCVAEDAQGSCCLTRAMLAKQERRRRVLQLTYHTWMHTAPDWSVCVL